MWRRGYYSISPVMMTKKPSPPTTQVPNKKDFVNIINFKIYITMYYVMRSNSLSTSAIRMFDSKDDVAFYCELMRKSAIINDDNNKYFCVEEF